MLPTVAVGNSNSEAVDAYASVQASQPSTSPVANLSMHIQVASLYKGPCQSNFTAIVTCAS